MIQELWVQRKGRIEGLTSICQGRVIPFNENKVRLGWHRNQQQQLGMVRGCPAVYSKGSVLPCGCAMKVGES